MSSMAIGPAGSYERPRGYSCTDTVLEVTGEMVLLSPTAWRAACAWARSHDIDPMNVPADSTIVRDVEGFCVRYTEVVFDADGKVVVHGNDAVTRDVVSQGEGPPLPFPPELWRELGHLLELRKP